MELQLGPEIIASYKRLAYTPWYALAEFVDNSTQAYFNNKVLLGPVLKKNKEKLTVEITTEKTMIRIKDNSIGMSEAELENALQIGRPPINAKGRSKYGLGLKTGASWFGDLWTVATKRLGETSGKKITVDVNAVAEGDLELPEQELPGTEGEHYTVIEIRKLHRNVAGRTLRKVKDYLRSLYRRDITSGLLVLKLNGETLTWDADFDARLLRLTKEMQKKFSFKRELVKQRFSFKVNKKKVTGWAGVLERGSRRDAGFSIIQAERVIQGWPDSYRPTTIFGDQEGGSNDLVNQRLCGELVLEKFEVSHTKDRILFDDGEQEELEAKLASSLGKLREIAQEYRSGTDERIKPAAPGDSAAVLKRFEREMKSEDLKALLNKLQIPSDRLIKKMDDSLASALTKRVKPDVKATIDELSVFLYLTNGLSPTDPYVLIELMKAATSVAVIINKAHPYWKGLTNAESMLNFVRHCTYDGVAESKAYSINGAIAPNTVKLIKDRLLRLPMSLNAQ